MLINIHSNIQSSTCLELAEVCKEVGLPPGVINILTGLGHEAGAPLASHPHVDKVRFSYPGFDTDATKNMFPLPDRVSSLINNL